MVSLSKATRTYSAISGVIEQAESPFLVTAKVLPSSAKLSQAYYELSCTGTEYSSHILKNTVESLYVDEDNLVVKKGEVKVDLIKSLAVPAPFGKGGETVLDTSVRNAFEISADRITIKNAELHKEIMEMLERMAPFGKKLVPKLYKLHMYEEGGMFLPHRDTIHASNHYATLITSLPSRYEGGEFVLETGGKERKFNLKSESWRTKYIVFLTDLVHQVLPVTSGARVVLQYDVFLEDADVKVEMDDDRSGEEEVEEDEEEEEEDRDDDYENSIYKRDPNILLARRDLYEQKVIASKAQILSLVEEFFSQRPGATLSFMLTHLYPMSLDSENLRSSDRSLYEILSQKYNLELGFAVNKVTTDYDGGLKGSDADVKSLYVMNYPCKMAFNEYIESGSKDAMVVDSAFQNYVVFGNGADFEYRELNPYLEYTGNEAQVGEYVYSSAVISVGPPLLKS